MVCEVELNKAGIKNNNKHNVAECLDYLDHLAHLRTKHLSD